jgi:hypothetical protein
MSRGHGVRRCAAGAATEQRQPSPAVSSAATAWQSMASARCHDGLTDGGTDWPPAPAP